MNKHVSVAREFLCRLSRGVWPGCEEEAGRIAARLPAPRRRTERERASRAERAEKKEGVYERRSRIRSEVQARAAGHCECWFHDAHGMLIRCSAPAAEWDHFWGRKHKEQETAEGTWMLCRIHHHLKTLNKPSRQEWLSRFQTHAGEHGYVEQLQKIDKVRALEEAQHPAAARAAGGER